MTLSKKLQTPRAVWLMVPAAVVDASVAELATKLQKDDVVIDGGNSHYIDDIRRAKELQPKRHSLPGRGHERRCLGPRPRLLHDDRRRRIGRASGSIPFSKRWPRAREPSRERRAPRSVGSTAEQGYLHCGPAGAGHFVKMVHNGIEYGMMAAYAEGLNVLKHANVGKKGHASDAETTPLRSPEHYQYDLNLPDDRRGVAARQRRRVVAARPDAPRLWPRIRACRSSPAACRIRERGGGRSWPPWKKERRRRC